MSFTALILIAVKPPKLTTHDDENKPCSSVRVYGLNYLCVHVIKALGGASAMITHN